MAKRADIELRAASNAQAPQDPAGLEQLKAAATERQTQLTEASNASQTTAQALAQAQSQLAEQRKSIERLQGQRRKLVDRNAKQQKKLEKASAGAEGTFAGAICDPWRKPDLAERRLVVLHREAGFAARDQCLVHLPRQDAFGSPLCDCHRFEPRISHGAQGTDRSRCRAFRTRGERLVDGLCVAWWPVVFCADARSDCS